MLHTAPARSNCAWYRMRVLNSVRAQADPGLAAILSQPMLWTHDAILETVSTRESDLVPSVARDATRQNCQFVFA